MRKLIILVSVLIVLAALAIGVYVFAATSFFTTERLTIEYLRWGTATSTLAVRTHDVDQVTVLVSYNASTTDTYLDITPEFSNDNATYFGRKTLISTNTGELIYSTSTLPIRWNPNATGTTTAEFVIKDLAAGWLKLSFSAGTSTSVTSAGAIEATVNYKRSNAN